MKKILFISYDGLTDPLGPSQIIPYLTGLTQYNYEFTILSCDKPNIYKKNKQYVNELIEPYPIKWVSIPYHKSPAVLSSVFDFYQLKKTAKHLHRNENFDMVHTRPGVPTLVALWLKKKYGIKFLNDIRGFWADERVDGGMWNLKNPLYKKIYSFFKKHEFKCIEKADHNTCLTEKAKEEIQSWGNIANHPVPIEVIACSADLNSFNPEKIDRSLKQKFEHELNIDSTDFILSYLGSIGGWYLVDEMMHFFKLLIKRKPAAKFLFISPHRYEVILEAAQKYNIPAEKILFKSVIHDHVPALLSLSNYSIFFIKPCYSKISSSPTKHGEIMALGIPVITNSGVGDVEEITNQCESGYIIDSFTSKAYEKVIDKIGGDATFNPEKIIQGAKIYYDLNVAIQKYSNVYNLILNK